MKGIRKILSIRLIATCFSLVMQLGIMLLLLVRFDGAISKYYALFFAVSVIMCVYVVNSKQNSDYKIAWILLLLGFSVFGAIF